MRVVGSRYMRPRWLTLLACLMAIALGGLHTWAAVTSHSMNADGINYLDMGDAYMRGDWETAINPVWSPMYAWVLGLIMRIFKPSMRWEFPLVQLVNLIIYLAALASFTFFWQQARRYWQARAAEDSGARWVTLPDWAWTGLGYVLFVQASLQFIEIWSVTPDMLMSCFVYLAGGLTLRMRLGSSSYGLFALLGMVLGLGYLTKAIMLPLSLVFLAISLVSTAEGVRHAFPRVLTGLLAFLALSAPYIAVISVAQGELTLGDAGALTYVRYVNGIPYPHWQGEPPGSGTPVHPSRKILDRPPIYEFGTPVGGTYPISYDPSYWYEGVVARVDLSQQARALVSSLLFYFDLFFRRQGGLLFGVSLLYLMEGRHRSWLTSTGRQWGLAFLALAAFAAYALVYVEGRYVGAFVLLFWADLLANVRLPKMQGSQQLLLLLGSGMILFLLLSVLAYNLEGVGRLASARSTQQVRAPSWPGEVAEQLHALDVQPGDKVAVIGYAFDSYWARLARVRIVAEMPGSEADPFWFGDASMRARVLRAFASTGADAVVAEGVPSYASLAGWQRVGLSDHYIYLLRQ